MYLQGEPTVDGPWLECASLHTKTSNRSSTKRLLPLAGLANGASGAAWAEHWLRARAQAGLRAGAGQPTMPRPALGRWAPRPLTVSEASIWLREILVALGTPLVVAQSIASHSLRTTILSWCAKAGLSLGDRRLWGQHVKAGAVSVITYSRDALAGPLAKMQGVVEAIQLGKFLPDETRSGRWVERDAAERAESADESLQSVAAASSDAVVEEVECGSPSSAAAEDENPSASSSDEPERLLRSVVDETQGPRAVEARGRAANAGDDLWRHNVRQTFHLGHVDTIGKLACGRLIVQGRCSRLLSSPAFMWPRCNQGFGAVAEEDA